MRGRALRVGRELWALRGSGSGWDRIPASAISYGLIVEFDSLSPDPMVRAICEEFAIAAADTRGSW